ncbi:hypothetical protein [Rosenbergiella collisarenosi]|nr:hypothetical protein [Rosenbergiella collisarenosi]
MDTLAALNFDDLATSTREKPECKNTLWQFYKGTYADHEEENEPVF